MAGGPSTPVHLVLLADARAGTASVRALASARMNTMPRRRIGGPPRVRLLSLSVDYGEAPSLSCLSRRRRSDQTLRHDARCPLVAVSSPAFSPRLVVGGRLSCAPRSIRIRPTSSISGTPFGETKRGRRGGCRRKECGLLTVSVREPGIRR